MDKLLGPGNQYVTAAKMLAQSSEAMVSIDMPAGPSEVLVIADAGAPPAHVAADLLSQAEHGPDSQVWHHRSHCSPASGIALHTPCCALRSFACVCGNLVSSREQPCNTERSALAQDSMGPSGYPCCIHEEGMSRGLSPVVAVLDLVCRAHPEQGKNGQWGRWREGALSA